MHARFAEVNHSSFWYLKTLYIQLKENIYFPVVKGVHTRWRRHQIINVSMCEHDNLMKFSAILRHPFGLEITVLEGLSLGRRPKDIATEHFYSFISQYMSSCTACLDFFLKSTGEKKRQLIRWELTKSVSRLVDSALYVWLNCFSFWCENKLW